MSRTLEEIQEERDGWVKTLNNPKANAWVRGKCEKRINMCNEEEEEVKREEEKRENFASAAKWGADAAADHFVGDALGTVATEAAVTVAGEGAAATVFGGTVGGVPGMIAGAVVSRIARAAYNHARGT